MIISNYFIPIFLVIVKANCMSPGDSGQQLWDQQ